MATYKTPDVYVQEISLLSPSVAEVETAIPAFIGYTKKADEFGPGDLKNVPVRVTSLLEYEELFGGAPPINVDEIVLDENNVVSSQTINAKFYLYDSLRLFFKNGGGKCYIVSIGSYKDTFTKAHFETGLSKLKKKDEPTMILFPDAVLFESNALYDLQQQALSQCSELQDRFGIFDLLESKASDATFDWQDGIDEFRNNVGINNLKYGAAYTPWLKSNLGLDIHYRDVKGKITRGGNVIALDILTNDSTVQDTISDLDDSLADVGKLEGDVNTLKGSESSLRAKYVTLVDDFKGGPTTIKFKALFNFIYDIVMAIDGWGGTTSPVTGGSLKTDIANMIANSLKASMETLIGYDRSADSTFAAAYNLYAAHTTEATEWADIFGASAPPADASTFPATGVDAEKMRAAEPKVTLVFNQVNAAVAQLVSSSVNYESTFENNLYNTHTVYKNMIDKLETSMTTLPPGGAIAGIYAMVDSSRGVWKAPANVSLSSVSGITEIIDNKEQEDLNVDVVAGKSINAIRPFTGKGILVWGARTLAGNDNEWRYVSVRRFFNMVEESIKKSTYWAVFEPNDANTWIKVKSMIENYLTQKWRDGALAGSKPDEAFFVNVGLGVTMTAQDILEGRMNVEIGMAVVRPAEFIILKFSHKMQES